MRHMDNTKRLALAEATANVLRLQQQVRQLTCDCPVNRAEIERLTAGNELARVLMLELAQVRDAVLNYQPKNYIVG